MIRTFACPMEDLLDDDKRREWDKTISDFESEVIRVKCSLVGVTVNASDGIRVVQYHVKKDGIGIVGQSQFGPVQGPTPGSEPLSFDEFQALVSAPAGQGVRVLH